MLEYHSWGQLGGFPGFGRGGEGAEEVKQAAQGAHSSCGTAVLLGSFSSSPISPG